MKLVRYFLVGGAAAAVDFLLFGILFTLTKDAWFESALISFVAATLVNYRLSVKYVFQSGVRFTTTHEIFLVFLVSGIGLVLNQSAIWLLYRVAGLNIWYSKILATGAVFIWNFAARNFFVFKTTR